MQSSSRGTGRTYRMMKEARQLSSQGKAVYIIAANERDAVRLRRELGNEPHGIKVETAGSLDNFDWQSLRLLGAHPNCVVLVDHYAIEIKFAKILAELKRYEQT